MFVTFDLPATIKLILALIFSVGVASLLFMVLEGPMISLGQRLSTKLRPAAGGNERLERGALSDKLSKFWTPSSTATAREVASRPCVNYGETSDPH